MKPETCTTISATAEAGRPPKYGKRMGVFSLRLPEHLAQWVGKQGGTQYLRSLVERDYSVNTNVDLKTQGEENG